MYRPVTRTPAHLVTPCPPEPVDGMLPPMNATTADPTSTSDASLSGARGWFAEKGLSRPRHNRLLGGVCAGLARRYGVNLMVMRVLGVLSALIVSPLLYIALWVLMPRDA
jgi:phage shock protein PspC (stress-responsive transcriptional regulator)